MKKHKDAIKKIRQEIKGLAAEKAKTRAEINALKFDAEGKRRPETGPTRHTLKVTYDWHVRPYARANLLAYGLLRGIPYKKMEPTCDENELHYVIPKILHAIQASLGDNKELQLEWTLERVKKLILEGVDPLASPEAA